VEISSLKTHQQTGKRETQTQTQKVREKQIQYKIEAV
jgi:hypothetical protein